jgi:hypothetical protein
LFVLVAVSVGATSAKPDPWGLRLQAVCSEVLGLGVVGLEVEHGHLHVFDRDLSDGPVPVVLYG